MTRKEMIEKLVELAKKNNVSQIQGMPVEDYLNAAPDQELKGSIATNCFYGPAVERPEAGTLWYEMGKINHDSPPAVEHKVDSSCEQCISEEPCTKSGCCCEACGPCDECMNRDEEAEEGQEDSAPMTLRSRLFNALRWLLNKPMVFYVAGLIDGLLVAAVSYLLLVK